MIVCACQNICLDEIVEAMAILGDDTEAIKRKTNVGKGCGECLENSCEEVDLPFPYALLNAEAILKQR